MIVEFVAVAQQKDMVKFKIDGNVTWAYTTANVKAFAGSNFKEGEVVTIEKGADKEGLIFVTRITKGTGGVQPQQTAPTSTEQGASVGICVCGEKIDPKYKKCWKCNNKSKTTGGDVPTPYVPNQQNQVDQPLSKNESIERQNCNNATSRSLIGLAGHINSDNVLTVAELLWNFYHNKLK